MLRTQTSVIYTSTGEPLMPVRLYYKVHNEYMLIKGLKKLKCVIIELGNKEFVVSYHKEAKRLNLEVYYQDVPDGLYPIALAHGSIRSGGILHIALNSLQRATQIVDLLAKYIPPTVMEITNLANSNKLAIAYEQDIGEVLDLDYDKFFEGAIVCHDEDKLEMSRIKEMYEEEQISELQEKLNRLETYIGTIETNSYPDIEKITITYNRREHNNIIKWLTIRSMIKETMAIEHYMSNSNHPTTDSIKDIELINDYEGGDNN